jgi:hypothetical protein
MVSFALRAQYVSGALMSPTEQNDADGREGLRA